MAVAAALVAVFSLLLVKMVGRVRRWTWLIQDTPSWTITVGVRAAAVAAIALSFLTITIENSLWFSGAALLFGLGCFVLIGRFDLLRRVYTHKVPAIAANGSQLLEPSGKPIFKSVVIGDETNMGPDAKKAWAATSKTGVRPSLTEFMAGYGTTAVNDPEAIW